MGEIAESLINGEFDYITGEYLGEGVGYPRTHAYGRRNALPIIKKPTSKANISQICARTEALITMKRLNL